MSHSNIKSTIAISSCKGGVGKSTVSALLAKELVQQGFKVGLLDADVFGPSMPTLFNLQNEPIYSTKENHLIPIEKDGLKIMSFGFLLGDSPAVMRGPMVAQYIQQILKTTVWGDLDYLLIDMPPGTGDIQLTITQTIQLNGAVVITTPHSLSLVDVARGILMFEKVDVPILGIIENMAFFECDGCQKKHYPFGNAANKLTERFGINVLAQWPMKSHLSLENESGLNKEVTTTIENLLKVIEENKISAKDIPQVQFDDKKVTLIKLDGSTVCIGNKNLRLSCKCALCIDEFTGEKKLKEDQIKENIAPLKITPLGNYAVSIQWNDGHSSGIYPYSQLA